MSGETDINMLRVFRFVRDYKAENGISPSQREIAKGTLMAATTMVQHLARLEARDWIVREYNIPRAIQLGEQAPDDETFEALWQAALAEENT